MLEEKIKCGLSPIFPLETTAGNEQKKIKQKIKNLKQAMAKRRKGEQHSQNAKK